MKKIKEACNQVWEAGLASAVSAVIVTGLVVTGLVVLDSRLATIFVITIWGFTGELFRRQSDYTTGLKFIDWWAYCLLAPAVVFRHVSAISWSKPPRFIPGLILGVAAVIAWFSTDTATMTILMALAALGLFWNDIKKENEKR